MAVMKTWAAELSSHCSVVASSAAAPGALPGRWEVGQVLIWGAERCWEPWAGQAGAVTTARIRSEWIPLNRALSVSEGWGRRGGHCSRAGEEQAEADSRHKHSL